VYFAEMTVVKMIAKNIENVVDNFEDVSIVLKVESCFYAKKREQRSLQVKEH